MKVILLEDVKNIGKKGSIVEVNNGYATNFLIPRKLAVVLTKTSLDIKHNQEEESKQLEKEKIEEAEILKKKLENIMLIIKTTVGKEGKLFGSISSKNIVDEYKNQFDIELDKRKFINIKSINTLGVTKIQIELYKKVIGTLTVQIIEK